MNQLRYIECSLVLYIISVVSLIFTSELLYTNNYENKYTVIVILVVSMLSCVFNQYYLCNVYIDEEDYDDESVAIEASV